MVMVGPFGGRAGEVPQRYGSRLRAVVRRWQARAASTVVFPDVVGPAMSTPWPPAVAAAAWNAVQCVEMVLGQVRARMGAPPVHVTHPRPRIRLASERLDAQALRRLEAGGPVCEQLTVVADANAGQPSTEWGQSSLGNETVQVGALFGVEVLVHLGIEEVSGEGD